MRRRFGLLGGGMRVLAEHSPDVHGVRASHIARPKVAQAGILIHAIRTTCRGLRGSRLGVGTALRLQEP